MSGDCINQYVTCWKLELKSGRNFYFTDSDCDISIDKKTYICGSYFTPSKIENHNELAQDNFKIQGIIDDKLIKKDDLLSGEFSEGFLEVFLVDLLDSKKDKITLKTGWLGEIKCNDNSFSAEICSLSYKTKNTIGNCYSNTCRTEFADSFCKMKKEEFTFKGKITNVAEDTSFFDETRLEEEDYFTRGILTFTSGKNKNKKITVTGFRDSKITLDYVYGLNFSVGDEYNITAGCDKSLDCCISKFNNAINFRGEPFIPNRHQLAIGN
ncbi:MAG: DUF2163 domain-containing protein [Pseudomonadota bacterium]